MNNLYSNVTPVLANNKAAMESRKKHMTKPGKVDLKPKTLTR